MDGRVTELMIQCSKGQSLANAQTVTLTALCSQAVAWHVYHSEDLEEQVDLTEIP